MVTRQLETETATTRNDNLIKRYTMLVTDMSPPSAPIYRSASVSRMISHILYDINSISCAMRMHALAVRTMTILTGTVSIRHVHVGLTSHIMGVRQFSEVQKLTVMLNEAKISRPRPRPRPELRGRG